MGEKQQRRWWHFRLRTLLIAAIVLSIPMAWVSHARSWAKERRRLRDPDVSVSPKEWRVHVVKRARISPPFPLAMFGEVGFTMLWYFGPDELLNEAERLFPEAKVLSEIDPNEHERPRSEPLMFID